MDMKQLIAQIDHIASKQILNEGFPTVADAQARADKEKTTGKFDKKELSTGTQYTRKSSTFDDGGKDSDTKKAEKKAKVKEGVDQTSIYEMLIREFGYDLNEVANPYQGADAAKFAAMSPADQAWLTKGGGVPDINDQFILARAPNKGAAVAKPAATAGGAAQPAPAMTAADQDDADMGAAMAANAAAAPTAADQDDAAMGAAMTANAAAAAPTAGGDTGEVPGVTTQAGATPAAPAGGAAQPARPAANKAMTPAVTAYASRLGLLKNNKPDVAAIRKFQQDNGLKADGIIGPNTVGAIISASGSNMGGGGGGPAPAATKPASGAAQPAAAPAAGQAAQSGSGPDKIRAEIDRFKSKNNMSLQANKEYVARLQAKLDAAAPGATKPAGGAAQPAAPAATKSALPSQISDTPAAESVKSQDDAILERIRAALFR